MDTVKRNVIELVLVNLRYFKSFSIVVINNNNKKHKRVKIVIRSNMKVHVLNYCNTGSLKQLVMDSLVVFHHHLFICQTKQTTV
jgi:hypothetical protein